jgi:hypothetical protein
LTITSLKDLDGDGVATLPCLSEKRLHLLSLTEAMKGFSERTAWLLLLRSIRAAEFENDILHRHLL